MNHKAVTITMYNRIWVTCTHCGSSQNQAYFGSKPVGMGQNCPTCGSPWIENEVIASTGGKSLSVILGDVGSGLTKGLVKVVWLAPQSGNQ